MKLRKIFFVFVLFLILPIVALAATPATPSNLEIDEAKALVLGVTPSDTEVVVFVDDNFLGMATIIQNNETESNNFSFSFLGLLSAGNHELKVAAKDIETRSLSKFSAGISFFVNTAVSNEPKVSEKAATEENPNISAGEIEKGEEQKTTEEPDPKYLLDVNDLPEASQSGIEKQENVLRWNLVIFILFLIAIISWIFWVNHELKKEKEEQAGSE